MLRMIHAKVSKSLEPCYGRDTLVQLHVVALKSECGLIDTMENRKEHLLFAVPTGTAPEVCPVRLHWAISSIWKMCLPPTILHRAKRWKLWASCLFVHSLIPANTRIMMMMQSFPLRLFNCLEQDDIELLLSKWWHKKYNLCSAIFQLVNQFLSVKYSEKEAIFSAYLVYPITKNKARMWVS